MKIEMIEQYSGTRHDGRQWPAAYEPFDVGDDEGKALIAHGVARPVKPASAKADKPADPPAPPADPPAADPPAGDPAAKAPAKRARSLKDQLGD